MAVRRGLARVGYYAVFAFSLTLVGVVSVSYVKDYRRSRALDRELKSLGQDVSTLQTRHVELSDLIQYFDSEGYAERRARLELGLAKSGEKVIVVPKDREVAPDAPSLPPSSSTPWRSWWSYFFGRRNAAEP